MSLPQGERVTVCVAKVIIFAVIVLDGLAKHGRGCDLVFRQGLELDQRWNTLAFLRSFMFVSA